MSDHDDRLIAAIELIGRGGATNFEVGFLHDDVPAEEADWWARARWRGHAVVVEHHTNPMDAAEELAARVTVGGVCIRCGRTISLNGISSLAGLGVCIWTRAGEHWVRGCDGDHQQLTKLNRQQRRRRDQVRNLGGR